MGLSAKRSRPLVLGATIGLAIVAAAACSSSEAGGPTAVGRDAATEATPTPTDGAAETSTTEAGDGGALPADITVLAEGFVDLAGVVATETAVYFVERAPGIVHAVPLTGGTATNVATNAGTPSSIAVTGADLFWGDRGQGTLSRSPLAGGTAATATPSPGRAPAAIVATVDRIVVVALGNGDVGEIQQYGLDFSAGPAIGPQNNPYDVAVRGSDFFWTEGQTGTIWTATLGASLATQAATLESDCQSIAADASGLYWSRPSEGMVRAKLGTSVTITLATAQKSPSSLAADASGVYWLTSDGKLRRSTRNELPLRTVAQGFSGGFSDPRIQALALTNDYVVWVTPDGKVLRHDK